MIKNKSNTILFLFSINCFLLSCNSIKYQKDNIVGTYETADSLIKARLSLNDDFTFNYNVIYDYTSSLCLMTDKKCSINGFWGLKGNSIVLNSIIKSHDQDNFVQELKLFEWIKDSVLIEVLNLSDGSPVDSFYFEYRDKNNQIIYSSVLNPDYTNSNGIVIFPSEGVKYLVYSSNNCGNRNKIQIPKPGYYSRIYFMDCYLVETFNNKKMTIKGDSLILKERLHYSFNKRGLKKYKVFEKTYVKVK